MKKTFIIVITTVSLWPYFSYSADKLSLNNRRPAFNDSIPDFDRGIGESPIYLIGSEFLGKDSWVAPVGYDNITTVTTPISPSGLFVGLLGAVIFNLNSIAFTKEYAKAVESLVKVTYSGLQVGEGQLFRFKYNVSDISGTVDLKSIRHRSFSKSSSPEESLATGELDEISARYDVSWVYPQEEAHYVWIYRNYKNNLEVSTTRDPFWIKAFELRAAKVKEIKIDTTAKPLTYSDPNSRIFELAIALQNRQEQYSAEIRRAGLEKDIQDLSDEIKQKQHEFEALYSKHKEAQDRQSVINSLLNVINACDKVISIVGGKPGSTDEALSSTTSESGYLKSQTDELFKDLNESSKQLDNSIKDINKVYRGLGIPEIRRPLT